MNVRGHWIVCVRDIPAGEDAYLGVFTSEERAWALAARLNRDITARGAQESLDAVVQWVRPHPEFEDFRDEMLADLDRLGYVFVPPTSATRDFEALPTDSGRSVAREGQGDG